MSNKQSAEQSQPVVGSYDNPNKPGSRSTNDHDYLCAVLAQTAVAQTALTALPSVTQIAFCSLQKLVKQSASSKSAHLEVDPIYETRPIFLI